MIFFLLSMFTCPSLCPSVYLAEHLSFYHSYTYYETLSSGNTKKRWLFCIDVSIYFSICLYILLSYVSHFYPPKSHRALQVSVYLDNYYNTCLCLVKTDLLWSCLPSFHKTRWPAFRLYLFLLLLFCFLC